MQPDDTPIRVLVADDSPIIRRVLVSLISLEQDMEVIAEASTGLEAVRLNHALKPQLIAMDVDMPVMDGTQATKVIMESHPTRVVLMGTSEQLLDPTLNVKVNSVGALDFCHKPRRLDPQDVDLNTQFIKILRALSTVGVVRKIRKRDTEDIALETVLHDYPGLDNRPEIVLIVSSTGGPQALEVIMKGLPPDFSLPIVVVQHISDEFVDSMTRWLDNLTHLKIKMASSGERPLPGYVYFAPVGLHLRFTFNGRFALEADTENYRHVPSGDVMLESAARAYGSNAIGVVLTGMGVDGARGLAAIRKQGARTIVQDEATSIVYGMPKAALDMGGGEFVASLSEIPDLLVTLVEHEYYNQEDAPYDEQ